MEEADIKVPLYYVMGREADIEAVQLLLSFTPCYYGVACNAEEKLLLQPIVNTVLQALDAANCAYFAEHIARFAVNPVLIVGEGKEVKAVYSTGEEETLCSFNPTSTN
jgi:hypothetical protein